MTRAPAAAPARATVSAPLGLHSVETLPARFVQDADQIDDDVGIAHRRLDRLRKAHIRLHRMDLADRPSGCK